MSQTTDLLNLSLEANGIGAGITANDTAISAISVGNTTVNSSINATSLTVGSNVATFGTAVYHVANGSVGIGTTQPTFRFVAANSTDDGFFAGSSGFVSTMGVGGYSSAGGGTLQIKYDRSTGQGAIYNGNRDTPTERITLSAAGLVGIGNTAPSNTLSVTGTASISGALTTGSNTATFGTAVYHVANGNVGIGMSSPGAKLVVSKNAVTPPAPSLTGTALQLSGEDAVNNRIWMDSFAASDNITFRRASGTAASPTATLNGDIFGFLSCVGYGTTGYSSGSSGQMRFNATQDFTDTARGTSIDFYTTPNGSTTSANRMIIDQAGNIGIANSTPSNTLSVTGTASISGALTTGSNVATFGTAVYHVANGNVGIGISSPTVPLQVYAGGAPATSGNMTTGAVVGAGAGSFALNIGSDQTAGYNWINSAYINGSNIASPLVFMGGTTERMRIAANGNVGIGTSSPASKLDVAGTITASAAAGTHTLDTSGATVSVANGGTVAFSSASGMFLVNNHNLGSVTIWLVGGGSTSAVSYVGATVGSVAYTVGIGGYTFTNNSGSTATFSFMFFRTRNTA
jgi:hypothetical protein